MLIVTLEYLLVSESIQDTGEGNSISKLRRILELTGLTDFLKRRFGLIHSWLAFNASPGVQISRFLPTLFRQTTKQQPLFRIFLNSLASYRGDILIGALPSPCFIASTCLCVEGVGVSFASAIIQNLSVQKSRLSPGFETTRS